MHGIIEHPFCGSSLDGPRVLSPEQYAALTAKARLKVDLLGPVMQDILHARKKRPAIRDASRALHADGLKLGPDQLAKLFYRWLQRGEPALVDHNLCGGRCGLPGCSAARASALREETVDAWLAMDAKHDRRALTESWRRLIAQLAAGVEIAGAGTWHDLYAELHPTKPAPCQCPWSVHRPPPGWSLKNFLARSKATKAERVLAKKGLSAGENELAKVLPVRSDTSTLRFMEVIVFDDHRLDFKVWVGREIVELWGLFAMDLATRTILGFGLRPRITREDGTRESVTRRDMQHLIAGILSRHGYPKRWTTTLLVENAAAAVTTECEALLTRLTQGQVVVHRTNVGHGMSTPDSYGELYGKPRGKRWLESWFNSLETSVGDVPGQMGASWTVQRGDFKQRERIGLRLAQSGIIATMPEAAAPFVSLERAFDFVSRGIHELHNRERHALQGFEEVRLWRWAEQDPEWKPVDDPVFLRLPTEQQNALMQSPATGLLRRETPAERKARLFVKSDFTRISPMTFAELMLDVVPAKYQGHDCITVRAAQGRPALEFYGTGHRCVPGQKVACRLDLDHPTHVWLQDEAGRVIGMMQARKAAPVLDREAHAEQLGQRQRALHTMLRNVRLRQSDPAKLAALDETLRMIGDVTPEEEAATGEETAGLLQTVSRTLAEGGADDGADLYLHTYGSDE